MPEQGRSVVAFVVVYLASNISNICVVPCTNRKFLREQVTDFARKNPQLQIEAVLGAGKHPIVTGSYIRGQDKVIDVKNENPAKILQTCIDLRNTTGRKVTKIKKQVYGQIESVQGKWQPDIR